MLPADVKLVTLVTNLLSYCHSNHALSPHTAFSLPMFSQMFQAPIIRLYVLSPWKFLGCNEIASCMQSLK